MGSEAAIRCWTDGGEVGLALMAGWRLLVAGKGGGAGWNRG